MFKNVKILYQGSTFCIYHVISWQQHGNRVYTWSVKNYNAGNAELRQEHKDGFNISLCHPHIQV